MHNTYIRRPSTCGDMVVLLGIESRTSIQLVRLIIQYCEQMDQPALRHQVVDWNAPGSEYQITTVPCALPSEDKPCEEKLACLHKRDRRAEIKGRKRRRAIGNLVSHYNASMIAIRESHTLSQIQLSRKATTDVLMHQADAKDTIGRFETVFPRIRRTAMVMKEQTEVDKHIQMVRCLEQKRAAVIIQAVHRGRLSRRSTLDWSHATNAEAAPSEEEQLITRGIKFLNWTTIASESAEAASAEAAPAHPLSPSQMRAQRFPKQKSMTPAGPEAAPSEQQSLPSSQRRPRLDTSGLDTAITKATVSPGWISLSDLSSLGSKVESPINENALAAFHRTLSELSDVANPIEDLSAAAFHRTLSGLSAISA